MFVSGALEPAAALQQRAMATALWPILHYNQKEPTRAKPNKEKQQRRKGGRQASNPRQKRRQAAREHPKQHPPQGTQATITYASGSCIQLGSMSALSRSKACAMFRAGPVRVSGSTLSVKGLMSSCIAAATV